MGNFSDAWSKPPRAAYGNLGCGGLNGCGGLPWYGPWRHRRKTRDLEGYLFFFAAGPCWKMSHDHLAGAVWITRNSATSTGQWSVEVRSRAVRPRGSVLAAPPTSSRRFARSPVSGRFTQVTQVAGFFLESPWIQREQRSPVIRNQTSAKFVLNDSVLGKASHMRPSAAWGRQASHE